jgi:hypothetical protein
MKKYAWTLVGATLLISALALAVVGKSPSEQALLERAALKQALIADVDALAGKIGERNIGQKYESLVRAEKWLLTRLTEMGYSPRRQAYKVEGVEVANIDVEIPGTARGGEVVVIGAHYDSAEDAPGANDNGSGVAANLALAQALRGIKPTRTLRFVFFTNEEPPYFQTDNMGSVQYARWCKQNGDKVVAMMSLETMGYYSNEKGSQEFPKYTGLGYLFPDIGNFIAFVGNWSSQAMTSGIVQSFKAASDVPVHYAHLPEFIRQAGFSDQWSFWQVGYPGLMVTDTALFRYPHYHEATDTPDKVNYEVLADVTQGLIPVIQTLAAQPRLGH